ncbi:TetR family transcriptional regulator [Streptomyces polyrhachis]|uniref:TetR family transcriptional regulator n=1 Tax=Streptomyces polyrhachis TaxID=1282885 RepID=A0ABW2GHG9_9ACTN
MTGFRQAVRTLLRDRILDAAYGLVAAEGWGRLRIAGVARAAGVSRQTVYNEFGREPREAIGRALVERETERFLLGIHRELESHRGELLAAARAGVGFVLAEAQGNALIKAILTAERGGGDDELLAYLTTQDLVFDAATGMLDAYAAEAWPEVDEVSRSLAVETIVRLTVSHIVRPSGSAQESAGRIAGIAVRVAYGGEGAGGGAGR